MALPQKFQSPHPTTPPQTLTHTETPTYTQTYTPHTPLHNINIK